MYFADTPTRSVYEIDFTENKNNITLLFYFQNNTLIQYNSTATFHYLCKKILDTSKNLLFFVILDEERGVLSELGF